MESWHFLRKVLVSVGLVLCLSGGVSCQSENPTCENVRNYFTGFQFAREIDMPENQISGAGLKVCRRETTCCTRRMEEKLQQKAGDDFRKAIQTNVDYLDFLLSSNANEFKEEFEGLLRFGELKVQQNVRLIYINIAMELDNDIQRLFSDLRAHLNGQEVKIQRSVRNFFDELFPLLYSQIDPSVGRLDSLFSSCLSAKRAFIQPFGDIPRQLGTLLYNSLETARIILKAVDQGQHVLNATFNLALGKRCSRALLEMNYCGACEGALDVRPCRSYCLNVVKGCLANFLDLDGPWNVYVTSVSDLISHSMMKDNDLQQAMNSLEYLFNDAVSYALENEGDITYEVHRLCGYPSRGRPSPINEFAAANPPVIDIPMVPNPSVPLDVKLLEFMDSLDRSRGVYTNLPTMMCLDGELGSSHNDDCWTGQEIGEYAMAPVANGLEAQIHNPEVSWTGREFELLQAFTLMDDLEDISHLIRMKLLGKNRKDAEELSGSGSGSGCHGDDEDCMSGSGDTSTPETKTDEIVFTPTTQEPTTEDTDFHFDATTARGPVSREPSTRPPLSSQWPFSPRGTTKPPSPPSTPKPVPTVGEREEVAESTTPKSKDSGARPAHTSSQLLVPLCLLLTWLWHRH